LHTYSPTAQSATQRTCVVDTKNSFDKSNYGASLKVP
jgi:hypothetical protein